jgi:hypothetical protein
VIEIFIDAPAVVGMPDHISAGHPSAIVAPRVKVKNKPASPSTAARDNYAAVFTQPFESVLRQMMTAFVALQQFRLCAGIRWDAVNAFLEGF